MNPVCCDSLTHAKPGDLIFYSSTEWVDKLILINGQRLLPSISKEGANVTHTAIVLSKIHVLPLLDNPQELKNGHIIIAHSYATVKGPHISVREADRLVEEHKNVTVVSPINKKEIGDDIKKEERIRSIISEVALQFSMKDRRCPARPCTTRRMMLRPIFEAKKSSKSRFRNKIAKGLVDFILGYPRIEKFDQKGNPIAKASFCSEFAHSVLQIAHFFERMQQGEIKKIQDSLTHLKKHPEDLQTVRNNHVQYIEKNFDLLFPEEGVDTSHWTYQKSTSFAPGRLFTALVKNGNESFTLYSACV